MPLRNFFLMQLCYILRQSCINRKTLKMKHQLGKDDQYLLTIHLRIAGFRMTLPRLAILGLLKQHYALTPAQLANELFPYGISRPTVYRSLKVLRKAYLIQDVIRGGKAHVELTQYAGKHTHLLQCTHGQWTQPFRNLTIERSITAIVKQTGLAVATHDLAIRGRCRKCQTIRSKRP